MPGRTSVVLPNSATVLRMRECDRSVALLPQDRAKGQCLVLFGDVSAEVARLFPDTPLSAEPEH